MMTHEQIAEVIAEAVKPIINEGRRALLRELEAIAAKPTGLNRREVVQFLQERGYKLPQQGTNFL
jgi:hypothetical protein